MLILLEGVDGSGKTVLCNQLKDRGFFVEKPVDRLETFQYVKWMRYVYDSQLLNGPLIFDRSFVSELVYRLFDDKKLSSISFSDMCNLLGHCKIVLCETDTSFEDAMSRGEDNITNKELSDQIKQAYSLIIKMFNKFCYVPTFTYNWKRQTAEDVIKFIESVL